MCGCCCRTEASGFTPEIVLKIGYAFANFDTPDNAAAALEAHWPALIVEGRVDVLGGFASAMWCPAIVRFEWGPEPGVRLPLRFKSSPSSLYRELDDRGETSRGSTSNVGDAGAGPVAGAGAGAVLIPTQMTVSRYPYQIGAVPSLGPTVGSNGGFGADNNSRGSNRTLFIGSVPAASMLRLIRDAFGKVIQVAPSC